MFISSLIDSSGKASDKWVYKKSPEYQLAYDALSIPDLREALEIKPKSSLYKQWLNREISFTELQKSLSDYKKREATME